MTHNTKMSDLLREIVAYARDAGHQWSSLDEADALLSAQATQPAEVTDERHQAVDQIMEQAQVFASAWALVGGRFDSGDALDDAHEAKEELREMVCSAILALRPVQVPMTDADTVQVFGVKDGKETLLGTAPMPARMKARELARENFGNFEDGDGSDAELCFGALEQLIDHIERNAHHGITAQADLWCIHIPGPDEVHAAPSKEAADHMAAKHNAAMATFYSSGAPNLEFAPSIESVQAVVIKWPHDQQSHANDLREFDWAGWGLTQEKAS